MLAADKPTTNVTRRSRRGGAKKAASDVVSDAQTVEAPAEEAKTE